MVWGKQRREKKRATFIDRFNIPFFFRESFACVALARSFCATLFFKNIKLSLFVLLLLANFKLFLSLSLSYDEIKLCSDEQEQQSDVARERFA